MARLFAHRSDWHSQRTLKADQHETIATASDAAASNSSNSNNSDSCCHQQHAQNHHGAHTAAHTALSDQRTETDTAGVAETSTATTTATTTTTTAATTTNSRGNSNCNKTRVICVVPVAMSSVAEKRVQNLMKQIAPGLQQQQQQQTSSNSTAAATQTKPGPVEQQIRNGGWLFGRALAEQGVKHLFTLTGGHIAPILVGAFDAGIRVIDVRDEATAVFAADASARLTGIPGVAVVTAGPGLTNTITAIKNAQLAQSPVVVLGGATATLLKNRGSLQDIDQQALVAPHVKWQTTITAVRDITTAVRNAFAAAVAGVPGPVYIECPLDAIWQLELMASVIGIDVGSNSSSNGGPSFSLTAPIESGMALLQHMYLKRHLDNMFYKAYDPLPPLSTTAVIPLPPKPYGTYFSSSITATTAAVAAAFCRSHRPILLLGSQAVRPNAIAAVVAALTALDAPCYLSGMARGLLGKQHALHLKHHRSDALAAADVVLLLGVPADFRLNYGRHLKNKKTLFITVNLDASLLTKNRDIRAADVMIHGDSVAFLLMLTAAVQQQQQQQQQAERDAVSTARVLWYNRMLKLQQQREQQISVMATAPTVAAANGRHYLNPLFVCKTIDSAMSDDAVIVADGGDFVGTAAYTVRARKPLGWLDPGVFGTLGVGGGFALAAAVVMPASTEIWVLYGDGAVGWSLAEFDTYSRMTTPVIAVVGNDACWSQMHRDQIKLLRNSVATTLEFTHYEVVAQGLGCAGLLVDSSEQLLPALMEAKRIVREERRAVLVNVLIAKSAFREGSVSL